jgi:hypothetical protein
LTAAKARPGASLNKQVQQLDQALAVGMEEAEIAGAAQPLR